jgi:hypothetical protein
MQVARVAVSEDQWRAFRALALASDISVSGYLGRLVTNELDRHKPAPVKGDGSEASDVAQALEALTAVRASIDELDGIAGRLARSAASGGASWQEVATPLRLSPEAARTAYERDHEGT